MRLWRRRWGGGRDVVFYHRIDDGDRDQPHNSDRRGHREHHYPGEHLHGGPGARGDGARLLLDARDSGEFDDHVEHWRDDPHYDGRGGTNRIGDHWRVAASMQRNDADGGRKRDERLGVDELRMTRRG